MKLQIVNDDGTEIEFPPTGNQLIKGNGGSDGYPLTVRDENVEDANLSIYGRTDGPGGVFISAHNEANDANVALSLAVTEFHVVTATGEVFAITPDGTLTSPTITALTAEVARLAAIVDALPPQ